MSPLIGKKRILCDCCMIETSTQNHFLLKCSKDHPINEKLQVDFISLKFLHCEMGLDLRLSKRTNNETFSSY